MRDSILACFDNFYVSKMFLKKFKFYIILFFKINIILIFLNYFNILISKIILKNYKDLKACFYHFVRYF
jgi:hypothetical protein